MSYQQSFSRAIIGLFLAAAVSFSPPPFAQEGADSKVDITVPAVLRVEHDKANQASRIIIPSIGGVISWNDVLRGLTRAGSLDDEALRAALPSGTIDITTTGSQFTIAALNLALSPEIRLRVLPVSKARQDVALLVTLDNRQLGKDRRNVKAWIRKSIENQENQGVSSRFGMRLDKDWQTASLKQPLVLVVHGFNSAPSQISGLVNAVRTSALPLGTYAYPNDQPISASAERLAGDLRKLAAEHPQRQVVLVTHSMGGLVARALIENSQLDPGNVSQLIMIAPPTHGSQLAHLSFGMEIWEYVVRPSEASEMSRFYAAIEDGLAEADYDLQPGSDFLRELNSRPRNKRVSYSLFLGTAGPLSPKQLQTLRSAIDEAARSSKAVQLVRPHLQEILGDFDEVLVGKGDGVVSVERGRLEGVPDTVLLEFTHLSPTGNLPTAGDRKLYEAIRLRLKQ